MNPFKEVEEQYGLNGGAIPKENWIPQLKNNKDVIASMASDKLDCMLNIAIGSDKYNQFLTKLYLDKVKWVDLADRTYREIISVPTDKAEMQQNIQMWSNNVCVVRTKDFSLTLNPYNGGVMIQGLIVNENKRGKGIGTKVMNKLYDLSERLDTPLYLTPYPDEPCERDVIWDKINRLRNWYSSLGFGSVFGNDWIWSNYYESDIV
jgi:hypothetical protein